MTDGKGRTVIFKYTILIRTSNLGSNLFVEMSDQPEALKIYLDDLLHQQFKPEFINRIDEIITLHSLSKDDLTKIIDIQISLLDKRLNEQNFTLEISDSAKKFLIGAGYDSAYGAKPLKRTILRYVQDTLAMKILEGHSRKVT